MDGVYEAAVTGVYSRGVTPKTLPKVNPWSTVVKDVRVPPRVALTLNLQLKVRVLALAGAFVEVLRGDVVEELAELLDLFLLLVGHLDPSL